MILSFFSKSNARKNIFCAFSLDLNNKLKQNWKNLFIISCILKKKNRTIIKISYVLAFRLRIPKGGKEDLVFTTMKSEDGQFFLGK